MDTCRLEKVDVLGLGTVEELLLDVIGWGKRSDEILAGLSDNPKVDLLVEEGF